MTALTSELPTDVWENIGKRLTEPDVSRFRAVCKSWRSLIPPFKKRPIQAQFEFGNYIINETVVYRLAPLADDPCKRSWLINVEERESGKTRLLHPLSHHPISLPVSFPKVVNLLDYRVFELAKFHTISHEYGNGKRLKKTVALNLDSPAIMTIFCGRLFYGKIGVDNKAFLENHWYNSARLHGFEVEDVAYYEGKFYAVFEKYAGEFVVIDSDMNARMRKAHLGRDAFIIHAKNLVVSSGELLLVVKYVAPLSFKVFKLNADEEQWVEVEKEALDDRIFMVGEKNGCFCASTRDFPGCKGNTFYFAFDGLYRRWTDSTLTESFRDIDVFRGSHLTTNHHTSTDNIFCPSPPSVVMPKYRSMITSESYPLLVPFNCFL